MYIINLFPTTLCPAGSMYGIHLQYTRIRPLIFWWDKISVMVHHQQMVYTSKNKCVI